MNRTVAESPAELAAMLESVLSPDRFDALIYSAIEEGDSSHARVSGLAKASYFHPNGFDKLVLDVLEGGQKVVLHVWRPDRDPIIQDSNFHDHRWNFATAILSGAYRFVEYEEELESSGEGLLVHKHEYVSPGATTGYELRHVGRCRLRPCRSETLSAGRMYLLRCEVIHHITLDAREPTVTLFVQGPPVRASTRVFSREPLGHSDEPEVHRFSTDEYASRVRSVVALLDRGAPAGRTVRS